MTAVDSSEYRRVAVWACDSLSRASARTRAIASAAFVKRRSMAPRKSPSSLMAAM